MGFDSEHLISTAFQLVGGFACSENCSAGSVAAALLTASGRSYTGICIDTACSLGFCAEHSAIAEMLKDRETQIAAIVAVNEAGEIMPPCGRCRELIRQVDPRNWDTNVVVSRGTVVALSDLMSYSKPSDYSDKSELWRAG